MKQEVYFDHRLRVVALPNLRAMCDRISGVAHTFRVDRITARFCYVEYSNPSEYGTPRPITAVYPITSYPGNSHIGVILNMVRCIGGDDLDSQAFDSLECQPELWKPTGEREGWRTTSEILVDGCAWWGIAGSILVAGFSFLSMTSGEDWKLRNSYEWESYCHKAWRIYR